MVSSSHDGFTSAILSGRQTITSTGHNTCWRESDAAIDPGD
jgi:hypothetical protein